ncbi:MAG: hypothetical protein U9Q69_05685 [Nanoarchaeota archaeon]|nr:hypothetical protein [Nanoarchaeota archaeon]
MVDETRDDLIEDLNPDELKVEKAKLKKEKDKKHLKEVEDEQWKNTQKLAAKEDFEKEQDLKDEEITEGKEEGLAENEKPEDVYDNEEVDDLLEDDEIEEQEAGFMEGYNRDSEKSKKKAQKSKEELLQE